MTRGVWCGVCKEGGGGGGAKKGIKRSLLGEKISSPKSHYDRDYLAKRVASTGRKPRPRSKREQVQGGGKNLTELRFMTLLGREGGKRGVDQITYKGGEIKKSV